MHHVGVEPHLAATEHLAGQLHQNPVVGGHRAAPSRGVVGVGNRSFRIRKSRLRMLARVICNRPPRSPIETLPGHAPTSKRTKRRTVVPASSKTAWTVFLFSVTDGCSRRTTSLK